MTESVHSLHASRWWPDLIPPRPPPVAPVTYAQRPGMLSGGGSFWVTLWFTPTAAASLTSESWLTATVVQNPTALSGDGLLSATAV